MSILRKERNIVDRAHLEAYLDKEGGFVPAKIITLFEESGQDVDTGEDVADYWCEVEPGEYARHTNEAGDTSLVFIPRGWRSGDPMPNSYNMPPDFLQPGDQLPVNGLQVVVLSRHDIPKLHPEFQPELEMTLRVADMTED